MFRTICIVTLTMLMGANCLRGEADHGGPATTLATATAEGRRAFDDLAIYYADAKKPPPCDQAIADLKNSDPAKQKIARAYLLAVFTQLWADETNGRAEWQRLPFWGGGAESPAREYRKTLAGTFGQAANGAAALDTALWLVNVDRLPESQQAGTLALRRIDGPKAQAALKELLARPHPSGAVLIGVLEEVGKRKLTDLSPQVRQLCTHYRKAVRDAAKAAATSLGLLQIPEYRPEDAFTPSLVKQLETVAAMVMPVIPPDAKWVDATITYPDQEGGPARTFTYTGWLVGQDDKNYRFVSWFGEEWSHSTENAAIKATTFADAIRQFQEVRAASEEDGFKERGRLSRRGGLTSQFEPRTLSLPEALVAAWAYQRGDKKVAAEAIFSRLDELADDRFFVEIARELIGNGYHQEMLNVFSYQRNYPKALAYAQHLSKPVFDGFTYQERAKELAAQLPARMDEFKAFRVPTVQEWKDMQAKLPRPAQIKYLADRLRLLNCRQWGQPGGVNLYDEQFVQTFDAMTIRTPEDWEKAPRLVNPLKALRDLKLEVRELPILVPYLLDDRIVPTFSYWRNFAADRQIYRVQELAATAINQVAKHDLAELGKLQGLDAAGKKRHVEAIATWCKANAGKTREQLLLETLGTARAWREVELAAGELASDHSAKGLPMLLKRQGEFPSQHSEMVELCYGLGGAEAVVPARQWVKESDTTVQIYAALILLKHGKPPEGLTAIKEILEVNPKTELFGLAMDDLLSAKDPAATALALQVLKAKDFKGHWYREEILRRLLLAGRPEVLEYLMHQLDDASDAGTSQTTRNGKPLQVQVSAADAMATEIANWRSDGWTYDQFAPDAERLTARSQLKGWLKEQLVLVQGGKPTALRPVGPIHPNRWQLDAP